MPHQRILCHIYKINVETVSSSEKNILLLSRSRHITVLVPVGRFTLYFFGVTLYVWEQIEIWHCDALQSSHVYSHWIQNQNVCHSVTLPIVFVIRWRFLRFLLNCDRKRVVICAERACDRIWSHGSVAIAQQNAPQASQEQTPQAQQVPRSIREELQLA